MNRALLVDKDYIPVRFLNEREAVYLLYLNKAELVVTETGASEWPKPHALINGGSFPAAATLRLFNKSVANKCFKQRFSRRVVFNRDNWTCQYCGSKLMPLEASIDHITPTSRGGKSEWLNCVTACHKCNRKKSDKDLTTADMTLLHPPRLPRAIDFWDIQRLGQWHPDWHLFLNR